MTRPDVSYLRDGAMFGPWKYRADNLTLEMTGKTFPGGSNPYYVDLEECGTPEGMLDWIFQIRTKTWADDACLAGLLHGLRAALHPQQNLCSFARRSTIKNVSTFLRARV